VVAGGGASRSRCQVGEECGGFVPAEERSGIAGALEGDRTEGAKHKSTLHNGLGGLDRGHLTVSGRRSS
jgi:hypothetical protein